MRNIYLVNLSFGLAGTERRFANIWHVLRQRGNVRAILVVPDTLAEILFSAGLAARDDENLWVVKEPAFTRALARIPLKARGRMLVAAIRSRIVARAYRTTWKRIQEDPDAIVHIGLNCSGLNPPDVPIVYECVDATLTQLGSQHFIKAAARPSVIHCQTQRIREALERKMAHRQPQWLTIVSPLYFASYPEAARSGIARDPTLIAFVGRLSPEKNPLLFVEALGRLRAAGVPCRAVILGEGPLRSEIARRISQLGLDSVTEVGFVGNPADRLLEAAISVSLQSGDNYGSQSLLEAMGAGCAIVATDVGETSRLVVGEVGRLVREDIADLTNALRELLENPLLTARMGAASENLARSRFTADLYVAFLEKVYGSAVRQREMALLTPK